MVGTVDLYIGSGLCGLLGSCVYRKFVLRRGLDICFGWHRGEQSEHCWRRINENQFVVILSDNWSFSCRVHVIKKNEVLNCLNRLASWVREKQLDIDWELAPAHFVHLKRRLGYCDDRLWEAWVKFELDFGDKARDVFVVHTSHVATPSIKLLLLDFPASKYGVSAKNDGLMD